MHVHICIYNIHRYIYIYIYTFIYRDTTIDVLTHVYNICHLHMVGPLVRGGARYAVGRGRQWGREGGGARKAGGPRTPLGREGGGAGNAGGAQVRTGTAYHIIYNICIYGHSYCLFLDYCNPSAQKRQAKEREGLLLSLASLI